MSERAQISAVCRRSKQPPACAVGRARPGRGRLVGVQRRDMHRRRVVGSAAGPDAGQELDILMSILTVLADLVY